MAAALREEIDAGLAAEYQVLDVAEKKIFAQVEAKWLAMVRAEPGKAQTECQAKEQAKRQARMLIEMKEEASKKVLAVWSEWAQGRLRSQMVGRKKTEAKIRAQRRVDLRKKAQKKARAEKRPSVWTDVQARVLVKLANMS